MNHFSDSMRVLKTTFSKFSKKIYDGHLLNLFPEPGKQEPWVTDREAQEPHPLLGGPGRILIARLGLPVLSVYRSPLPPLIVGTARW